MSGKRSKDKGSRFERAASLLIGQFWCGSPKLEGSSYKDSRFFIRTPHSGGGSWPGDIIPNNLIEKDHPDLYKDWIFSIECKNQEGFSLDSIARTSFRGSALLDKWVAQALVEARVASKIPLILATKNNYPTLVVQLISHYNLHYPSEKSIVARLDTYSVAIYTWDTFVIHFNYLASASQQIAQDLHDQISKDSQLSVSQQD